MGGCTEGGIRGLPRQRGRGSERSAQRRCSSGLQGVVGIVGWRWAGGRGWRRRRRARNRRRRCHACSATGEGRCSPGAGGRGRTRAAPSLPSCSGARSYAPPVGCCVRSCGRASAAANRRCGAHGSGRTPPSCVPGVSGNSTPPLRSAPPTPRQSSSAPTGRGGRRIPPQQPDVRNWKLLARAGTAPGAPRSPRREPLKAWRSLCWRAS